MALSARLGDFALALKRLEEAYSKTHASKDDENYTFFRDSAIQRFEFTLEIAWKSIKSFLEEIEGVTCRSPKSCIREFFASGHMESEEIQTLLEMVDDRNLATHTYHEHVAEDIFHALDRYLPLLKKLYDELQRNLRL